MSLANKLRTLKNFSQFLYVQRVKGFDVPDVPHMDAESDVEIGNQLSRARFYLEFGMGGSTILAGKRGVETISVDSDRFFAAATQKKLAAGNQVTVIHADIGLVGPWGTPVLKKPTAARVKQWRAYLDRPFSEIERRKQFPDFILIDGRFRVACALEAARRAHLANAETMLMIDDYGDRPHYRELEAHLGIPKMVGRAAMFEIRKNPLFDPISETLVELAMHDLR